MKSIQRMVQPSVLLGKGWEWSCSRLGIKGHRTRACETLTQMYCRSHVMCLQGTTMCYHSGPLRRTSSPLDPLSNEAMPYQMTHMHLGRNSWQHFSVTFKALVKRTLNISNGVVLQQERRQEDQLSEHVRPEEGQLTVGQKVKQAGKDASYMTVLLIGFGVTGVLVWYVVSELLFSFSPNSVYSKALDITKGNDQIKEVVGEPIKGYGEETSRGRRRHVSFQEYQVDGVNYMRVKFYVAGSKRKATVFADAKETRRGSFEFRYIFVELQGYPPETLVLVDNR